MEPLRFLGQFEASDHTGYVFASAGQEQFIAVQLTELQEQDAEDHYDDEERWFGKS